MSVKINSLEIENVKRIKAVKLEPSANGLTIIGGNNNQGKTSVLGTGRRQVQAHRCGKGRGIHRSHSPCGVVQRSDRRAKGQEQQPESH